jgi:Cu(I)/Ag(I) efflux system protein CusF
MRTPAIAIAILLGTTLLPAIAQTTDPGNPPSATNPSGPAGELPKAEAEVRRVDTAAGKISLKHGEIKNLDMPPMTMVFQVSDPSLLGKVKAGDKVRFTAAQVNGAYTVLSIEPMP